MKRFLWLAILALTTPCLAANFDFITGSKVQDAGGNLLATGQICFLGTDQNEVPNSISGRWRWARSKKKGDETKMRSLFKKKEEYERPTPISEADRLALVKSEVERQIKVADTRLAALDSEITDFARSNNLALNQFRGIEDGVGLPRQIITAFRTLHENRNRAAQDFQAALAVYAELK